MRGTDGAPALLVPAMHLHLVAVGGRGGWHGDSVLQQEGEQRCDRPLALKGGGGRRVGGQPWDSPLLQSRQGRARGTGAEAGGRDVHLCGAPSGLPLLRFCEWKHLQM